MELNQKVLFNGRKAYISRLPREGYPFFMVWHRLSTVEWTVYSFDTCVPCEWED